MSINIDNNHTKCAKAELSAKLKHLPHLIQHHVNQKHLHGHLSDPVKKISSHPEIVAHLDPLAGTNLNHFYDDFICEDLFDWKLT